MTYRIFKRIFDFILALFLILIFTIPGIIIVIIVKCTSRGPVLYISDRVGRGNVIFKMPKFRTMKIDTPIVATHLLNNADNYLTPVGCFLRRASLDELPQLFSILIGDMSFVGPRPALFNQDDLIEMRKSVGVSSLRPGLTGYAQINGRDFITNVEKCELDLFYLKNIGPALDLKIFIKTFFVVIKTKNVSH